MFEHFFNDQASRKSDTASHLNSIISIDDSTRVTELEHENDMLRRQLEKIGKLDGFATERSRSGIKRGTSPRSNSGSRERSSFSGRREDLERLREENGDLVLRLREQANELMELKQERESLLLTIQLLQDDLTSSERQRQRATPP